MARTLLVSLHKLDYSEQLKRRLVIEVENSFKYDYIIVGSASQEI